MAGGGNKGGDNLPISDITLNESKIVAVKSNNPWQIIVSANGQPVNADNFTFTSDNDSYASVDENGFLTVHKNDNATITVALKSDPTITTSLQVEKHTFEKFYRYGYTIFAIDSNGGLYGWGANEFGQLGVGNFDNQTLPQKVTFPDGAKLSSMDNFIYNNNRAFALLDNGKLYAWGKNDVGQLGVGDTANKASPAPVALPAKLSSMDNFIYYINNTFALLDDGSLYAWGYNSYGQLGVGNSDNQPLPQKVTFPDGAKLSSMANFTFSGASTFAILNDGKFYGWGSNNAGDLGVGDTTNKPSPIEIPLPAKLLSMDNFTFSNGSAFALLDNGLFYAWGGNGNGQIGVGSSEYWIKLPTEVPLPAKLSSTDNFTYSESSAFALLDNGSFYAWGNNYRGKLGVGDTEKKPSPIEVPLPAKLSSMDNLTFSNGSSFAILDNGLVYGWGNNIEGQLGLGHADTAHAPEPITFTGSSGKLLSMGNFTFNGASGFVILSDDSFYAWGMNVDGQLGVGDDSVIESSPKPVPLPAKLSSMDNFTIKNKSAFALLNDGNLYSWGKNDKGQLGVNSSNPSEPLPQKVLIPNDEKLLSYDKFISYDMNTFFITDKGFLYSVGMGDFGQLGNGSTDNQNTPQNVW